MAEDVLRLVGLVENVNYVKQSSATRGRPCRLHLLPANDLKVNMDAKFPLDSYRAYLDAPTTSSGRPPRRAMHGRARPRPGCCPPRIHRPKVQPSLRLVFIASEQIYSLVLQAQPDLIDEALALKSS